MEELSKVSTSLEDEDGARSTATNSTAMFCVDRLLPLCRDRQVPCWYGAHAIRHCGNQVEVVESDAQMLRWPRDALACSCALRSPRGDILSEPRTTFRSGSKARLEIAPVTASTFISRRCCAGLATSCNTMQSHDCRPSATSHYRLCISVKHKLT